MLTLYEAPRRGGRSGGWDAQLTGKRSLVVAKIGLASPTR